jgi:hypothetical protein
VFIHLYVENSNLDWWGKQFAEEMQSFAHFNDCSSIVLQMVNPVQFTNEISRLLQ